jgi:hypothetical protein
MHRAVLTHRTITSITGILRIAKYQRGYRWGQDDVERLLADIHASSGKPYCLQPVVVGRDSDDVFELIDGQQRLTTLYLLLAYLSKSGNRTFTIPYVLRYDTRPQSTDYLKALANNPDPAAADENIDAFHMYQAHETIEKWFDKQDNGQRGGIKGAVIAMKMLVDLTENVSVIWYEVPDSESATELFTRLNVGRIPLTDAELVKALLIARAKSEPGISDRANEIANRWDQIEQDLQHPDIWGFVSDNAIANSPTRILLLLDSLAGGPAGDARSRYHTFDKIKELVDELGATSVWDKVVELHALVLGWYEDRDLYHKIGYLVATGHAFAKLVNEAQGKTKSAFLQHLDDAIQRSLRLTPSGVAELSYERTQDKCHRLLLLMNVLSVGRLNLSTERYPFRHHRAGTWSLEHIHAQNSESLNTAAQWETWLKLHRDALANLATVEEATRVDMTNRINAGLQKIDKQQFDTLAQQLSVLFSDHNGVAEDVSYAMHSISNLALLESGHNSALNNAVFEVKRRRILELDRKGEYIPICTRQVFLKYFTDADAQHVHFWSRQDKEAYLATILSREQGVGMYLEAEGGAA